MNLFAGLEKIIRQDVELASKTWLKIGGPCDYFAEPTNTQELDEVVKRCRENSIPMFVLGTGANLLIPDSGVKGAVIHLAKGEFSEVTFDAEGVTVGAAVDMGKLVLRCVREGRSGLECLTGIPGSIGGCVKMNAGGAFGDIGSSVETVDVFTDDCEAFTRHKTDLAFAYRSTNINERFITKARFSLFEDDPHNIIKQVKQIWIYKKNTQPVGAKTAGCIFKNPRGMSAGALIDKAGMKGKTVGGAKISEKHANFIITDGTATAFDVLRLIDMTRDAVAREFSVNLEKEIQVW